MIIVVMGVSGCGKTTIGELLAERLNLPFYDADDFHPPANVKKMKEGMPLTDVDRAPWLNTLASQIQAWSKTKGAILSCSALKESYRKTLTANVPQIQWVHLVGSFEQIYKRMQHRKGHYMPAALLQSQFDTLEPPAYALEMDITPSPEKIVDSVMQKINHNG